MINLGHNVIWLKLFLRVFAFKFFTVQYCIVCKYYVYPFFLMRNCLAICDISRFGDNRIGTSINKLFKLDCSSLLTPLLLVAMYLVSFVEICAVDCV